MAAAAVPEVEAAAGTAGPGVAGRGPPRPEWAR